MRKLVALLCLVATPAHAAGKNDLGVTDQDCRTLAEYQPAPDTAYQPGADVHGKPVLEADLTPPVIRPPEVYRIPVTVDLARYMHLATPQGLENETNIGVITLDKNGASFNGTPLEGDAVTALKAICAEKLPEKLPAKHPDLLHTPENILNPGK